MTFKITQTLPPFINKNTRGPGLPFLGPSLSLTDSKSAMHGKVLPQQIFWRHKKLARHWQRMQTLNHRWHSSCTADIYQTSVQFTQYS